MPLSDTLLGIVAFRLAAAVLILCVSHIVPTNWRDGVARQASPIAGHTCETIPAAEWRDNRQTAMRDDVLTHD